MNSVKRRGRVEGKPQGHQKADHCRHVFWEVKEMEGGFDGRALSWKSVPARNIEAITRFMTWKDSESAWVQVSML